MFISTKLGPSLNLGQVGSKIRSLGQIIENLCNRNGREVLCFSLISLLDTLSLPKSGCVQQEIVHLQCQGPVDSLHFLEDFISNDLYRSTEQGFLPSPLE